MRQEIPLTDDEAAAVDEGLQLFEQLLEKLKDVPSPAGPSPTELRLRAAVARPQEPERKLV